MKIAIKRLLPRRMKIIVLQGYYLSLDALDFLLRRRPKGSPLRRRAFSVGALRYTRAGNWFLQRFLDLGELKSNERVLDVGCGIGRMAIPLTHYLNGGGGYEGFDVVPKNIRWCQENITARHPNFRFQLADVYNKEYNPKGTHKASEYTFPYKDESFDFVIVTSVFTHMLPEGVSNYLSEIERVMKGGGRSMITFFLLNQESLKLVESGMSNIDFRYDFGVYRTKEKGMLEAAVAYREDYVRALYRENGLEIAEPIRYGRWCGRTDFLRYQDIVVARKPERSPG
jgi:SAM-dependent methyltransferase